MPLQAIRAVAQGQNGVGAFILQCKSIDFHYCNWGGSSKGIQSFMKNLLPQFAKQNPGVELRISPRPNRHPVIIGQYMNGREKAICVRNLEMNQIMQKVLLLRNASGQKLKKVNKPVKSLNESVRGIWDPFHGPAHKV